MTVIIVLTWNVIITNYYCCFDLFTCRHYYSYVITHFEILATVVFPKCSHHNEFTTHQKPHSFRSYYCGYTQDCMC